MKKLITILLLSFLIGSSALAFKSATLTNGTKKVVVETKQQADKLFKQGYKLDVKLGSVIPVTPALFESSLASGIGASDSSMTMVKGTDISGAKLSGFMCFTLDSGTPAVEYVCGTASSTAVSSMTRGIDPITGVTSVTALKFSHRRGCSVKVTDYPVLSILARILNGDDTLPNKIKYTSGVGVASGDASTTLTDKNYVDSGFNQGAATGTESVGGIWKGASQSQMSAGTATNGYNLILQNKYASSTGGTATTTIPITGANGLLNPNFYQSNNNNWTATNTWTGYSYGMTVVNSYIASTTLTANEPVYLATSTNRILPSVPYPNNSVATSTSFTPVEFLGFTINAATNGSSTYVQTTGIVSGFMALTPGADYYVNATGTISTTMGTYPLMVGKAVSATQILIERQTRIASPISINIGTTYYAYTNGFINVNGGSASGNGTNYASCSVDGSQIGYNNVIGGSGSGNPSASCYVGKGHTYTSAVTTAGGSTAYFTPIN